MIPFFWHFLHIYPDISPSYRFISLFLYSMNLVFNMTILLFCPYIDYFDLKKPYFWFLRITSFLIAPYFLVANSAYFFDSYSLKSLENITNAFLFYFLLSPALFSAFFSISFWFYFGSFVFMIFLKCLLIFYVWSYL